MASYSRGLLVFAHAALRAERPLGGVLLRHAPDPGDARPRARRSRRGARAARPTRSLDWDGGTRIGESLKRFLDRYGHGGMARGAVVVICSDGLDIGDPAVLADPDGAASCASRTG